MKQPASVGDAIAWGTRRLRKREVDAPGVTSELLLAECLNIPRMDLLLKKDRELSREVFEHFTSLIQKRVQRIPLQYITGRAPFFSRDFHVDERVMIPRPETETLVQWVLERWSRREHRASLEDRPVKICDLGTGSGVILITLCRELPRSTGTGVDISGGALRVATKNARFHGVEDRIDFIRGDFLSGEIEEEMKNLGPFDLIVTNPPYVEPGEMERLQSEVRDHEPSVALKTPCPRKELYRRLCVFSREISSEGSVFSMELSEFDLPEYEMLRECGTFRKADLLPDHRGVNRIFLAEW